MADTVGKVSYDAEIELSKLRANAAEAERIAKNTGDGIGTGIEGGTNRADAAFQKFSRTMGIVMVAGGLAAAAGLAVAIKSSSTFESSLSQLAQASDATGAQMTDMGALARQLGRDTTLAGVTASDAALAMVELSKAGLSVHDTMDATKGVLALAKAGNIAFADAAVIAASALNAFGLEGKDATQVADMLAAGANASQAKLEDLAMGMQQSATVAKQFGLGLNETVTALALFANNGIRGSDAGTSLKTMLIALAKPSEAAASAMKEIGFNAYDASGQFVGLSEMSQRLAKATSGLTDEQKQNTLATIFGTDAFRAAAVLADNAGDSYDNMSKKVATSGAAQAAAAAQMGAYQRASETLSNAFSDLGLTIGTYLLPSATSATAAFAGFVSTITSGLPQAVATFMTLLPVVTGAATALLTYTGITSGMTLATTALAVAQGALNAVMNLNPFILLASLAAGVIATYFTLAGQTDRTTVAHDGLKAAQERLKVSTDALKGAEDTLTGANLTLEGAQLAVEAATDRAKEALDRFGGGSYEARSAAHDLEMAQFNLKGASERAAAAQQDLTNKERDNAAAAGAFVEASKSKANGAGVLSGALETQKQKMQDVNNWISTLDGRKSTYTVEQWLKTITTTENRGPTIPTGRAIGGPVNKNQPYFVGENPDGSLNRTSELFIPGSSGRIVNSKDLQAALGKTGESSGTAYNTFNISLPNVYNAQNFASEFKLAMAGRGY